MLPADMNLNELGQSVKGFNDELKTAQSFDRNGIKPKIVIVPKVVLTPKIASAPPKIVLDPALKVVSPKPNVRVQSGDVHEGKKIAIGAGIALVGIGYSVLT